MQHPLRILLAEYTLVSFIMTMIVPVSLYATDDAPINSGTGVIISETDHPTNTGETDEIPQIIATGDENAGTGTSEEIESIDNSDSSMSILDMDTSSGENIETTNDENSENITPATEINNETGTSEGTGSDAIVISPEIQTHTGTTETSEITPESGEQEEVSLKKTGDNTHENEILIQFKGSIDTTLGKYQLDQVESLHDLKTIETLGENNIAVMESKTPNIITSLTNIDTLTYIASQKEEKINNIIQELKNDPRIAHVQKNFVYDLQSVNDPDYAKLWGFHNEGQLINGVSGQIDADIDHPEAMQYASGKLGTGVIVAVLDTGIAYSHPDLAGHMWNGTQCLSDTGAALGGCIHGYDFGDDDLNPTDSDYVRGHGTHVSGIIGAITNNGTGTVGIAQNVQLMAVKIFGTKTKATTSSIIRGINFAKNNGAKVINASFGAGGAPIHTEQNFDYLTYHAIQSFSGLFVAGAGNDGVDTNNSKFFPAGFGSDTIVSGEITVSGETVISGEIRIPGLQNVISVAATDQNDNLASFSNYGTESVHIAAPGVNIYSTYPTVSSETENISATGGWTISGNSHTGTWQIGDSGAIFTDIRTVSGEIAYVSGENTYIEKYYSGNGMNYASLGSIPIWCNTPGTQENLKDYITIEYSTGGAYVVSKNINQNSLWMESFPSDIQFSGHTGTYAYVGIDSFDITQNFNIRLGWHTDGIDDIDPSTSTPYMGCKILGDAFYVNRTDDGESGGYRYLPGTSMATPHVAGAVALAWSYRPDATVQDIRSAIIGGGDYKSSLNNIMSSRRLNIAGMLKLLETPAIISQKVTLSGESAANFSIETTISEHYPSVLVSNNLDFASSSVFKPYADLLASNSVISSQSSEAGYRLGDNITRAELAKIAANIGGYVPTNCIGTIYTDVNSTIGDLCGTIEALAEAGVISTANASFYPNISVTRGEIIKILLAAIGETGSSTDAGYLDTANLGDITLYINRANELGCVADATYFRPNATMIRGETYKMVVCITGYIDLGNTGASGNNHMTTFALEQSASGTQYRLSVNNLEADITYYYKIQECTMVYCNTNLNTIYTFHTPKLIASTNNSQVIVSGEIYMQGSTGTGIIFSGGTSSGHIILINTGSTITVDLPTRNLQITSSGSWNGILEAPEQVSTGTTITVSGDSPRTVQQVWSVGNTDVSLSLSGQLATISLTLIAQSGSTADIFRSPNISTPYTKIATCTIMNNLCTFNTNHFSLFAIGSIQQPNNTNSGNGSTSGVMRGGGGPMNSAISPTVITNTVSNIPITISNQNRKVSRSEIDTKGNSLSQLLKQLNNKNLSKGARKDIKRSIQKIYKNQITLIKTSSQE